MSHDENVKKIKKAFHTLRQNIRKKGVPSSFVAILVILFVSVCALAWFSTTDAKSNRFKTGQYEFNVDLVDEFSPQAEVTPDQEISKVVSAVNTGKMDAFVRVMVFPVALKDNDLDEESEPMEVNLDEHINFVGGNPSKWQAGGDGYYYYLGKLAPGETAPNLFDKVTLTLPANQKEYEDAKLDIIVKTEAVDVFKWNYRLSWWGSDTPPDAGNPDHQKVDEILSQLAK